MTIFDTRLSLKALFRPNKDSPEFFNSLLRKPLDIGNYFIIICGDFNVIQNYDLDIKGYDNQNNPKSQQAICDMMNALDLHDIFREYNPDSKTWHKAGAGLKQAHLDYFLISSDITNTIEHTTIRRRYRTETK